MDSRIVEHRRKTCIACKIAEACVLRKKAITEKPATCPLGLHLSYEEALHAVTHPGPQAHGCCDTAEPGQGI